MISNKEELPWQYIPGEENRDDAIRWKTFCGGDNSTTNGISFGNMEVPPGGLLHTHHHAEEEAYFVQRGSGKVYLNDRVFNIEAGSIVFIPGDASHGVKNDGKDTLELLWIFAVDKWSSVQYNMEYEKTF